jgi:hypothetical protein
MVVMVGRTMSDGTVVRWYRNTTHARTGRPMVTASRQGVRVPEVTTDRAVVDAAFEAHRRLCASRDPDLTDLETHRVATVGGDVVPVEEVS